MNQSRAPRKRAVTFVRASSPSPWPRSPGRRRSGTRLSTEFSRHLGEPDVTKEKPLQLAQRSLLEEFQPPYLWAPFLLIGNWL